MVKCAPEEFEEEELDAEDWRIIREIEQNAAMRLMEQVKKSEAEIPSQQVKEITPKKPYKNLSGTLDIDEASGQGQHRPRDSEYKIQ